MKNSFRIIVLVTFLLMLSAYAFAGEKKLITPMFFYPDSYCRVGTNCIVENIGDIDIIVTINECFKSGNRIYGVRPMDCRTHVETVPAGEVLFPPFAYLKPVGACFIRCEFLTADSQSMRAYFHDYMNGSLVPAVPVE